LKVQKKMYTWYLFCIMNELFWHSDDVFIQAPIETIEKLKNLYFGYVCVVNLDYVVWICHILKYLILRCECLLEYVHPSLWFFENFSDFFIEINVCDTVRYRDVMKEYGFGPNKEILTFERGEDATIRIKAVLFHHILRPHHVADTNVGPEW
jgi:hypothetical protein